MNLIAEIDESDDDYVDDYVGDFIDEFDTKSINIMDMEEIRKLKRGDKIDVMIGNDEWIDDIVTDNNSYRIITDAGRYLLINDPSLKIAYHNTFTKSIISKSTYQYGNFFKIKYKKTHFSMEPEINIVQTIKQPQTENLYSVMIHTDGFKLIENNIDYNV